MSERVLVFGTFDGLHKGHEHMLKEARSYGQELIAVLALDSVVNRLKGRLPNEPFAKRREVLLASGLVDQVVSSDDIEGTYGVVMMVKPQIIAFGYDQTSLKDDCQKFLLKNNLGIKIVTLAPFEAETYKSSLLAKKN